MNDPKICDHCGEYEHDCNCLAARTIKHLEQELVKAHGVIKQCADLLTNPDLCWQHHCSDDVGGVTAISEFARGEVLELPLIKAALKK